MFSFDFLVIGSGIGGLGFALKAAPYGSVAVICKAEATATNTCLAQGGMSAVTGAADSTEQHVADTLAAGAGLCNEEMVRLLAAEAPACIQELASLGVPFTRSAGGGLDLGLEGGHTRHRIVHTHDHTGLSIQQTLLQAVRQQPSITIFENHIALDLLVEELPDAGRRCTGARVLNIADNLVFSISAKAVMLATGGLGQVYAHTTNPTVATGDGIAMAARAGAATQNLEFVQFHPTALYDPGKPTFLISEAVRGFGAELKRPDGTLFAKKYHPMGSLAPRDVLARAIVTEMQQHDSPFVYLDLRHLPAAEVKERFPKIYARCLQSHLDICADLLPVVPAAHYSCGGIVTDAHGCTTLAGLYACGEAACTGIHGANRLASNSLPEAWIFSGRAAAHAVAGNCNKWPARKLIKQPETLHPVPPAPVAWLRQKKTRLQQLMWQHAGIIRTQTGLLDCLPELQKLEMETEILYKASAISADLAELRNLIQVAGLILNGAINRKESIGCHYIDLAREQQEQHTYLQEFQY